MIGTRVGRLVVIERAGYITGKRGTGTVRRSAWLCSCDCGGSKVVSRGSLRSGLTQSCGCLYRESRGRTRLIHGATSGGVDTPEYNVWEAMKQRCLNPRNPMFKNYGARGIGICPEWVNDYERFLMDMGERPSSKHSLDRVDNARGYTPDNCEWRTQAQQQRNRRGLHWLTHEGRTMVLTDWAAAVGMTIDALRGRLRRGWSVERALTTPVR